ncbi:MAG TPA: Arm DNA-binding domain-containing protein, partial [Magnetospirillum sp.]|nr:Arm DNA-binding domain-containing protein [Magnetospirillum sp.]
MPKIKLTSLAVARLSPPEKGQADYFDAVMPAFGVRVSPAGTRTYFVMTRIHGKLARLTVGAAKVADDGPGLSLADARKKAGDWLEMAQAGHDPRQQRQAEKQAHTEKAANTFKAVGERFMRQHVEPRLAASTHREYKRVLFGPDTAAWANKPIGAVTRADVHAVLDGMIERGSPSAANSTLSYLSKFFNWCADKDLIEVPPTERMKKPSPTVVGERTL